MIKTILIPNKNIVQLEIPNSYIGKQIEVLLYATDEVAKQDKTTHTLASKLKGLLSNEEADKFDTYLKQARSEWGRDI